jgi:hypothetical protein
MDIKRRDREEEGGDTQSKQYRVFGGLFAAIGAIIGGIIIVLGLVNFHRLWSL